MTENERPGTEELERFALIGRIASGLAHELNGPIGVGISFTQLARETVGASDDEPIDPVRVVKLREYLRLIEEASLRARSLTRMMWSFAKARSGTVESFDIVETLTQASSLATPALKVAQIEARHEDSGAAVAIVRADPVICLESLVALFLASPSALPDGGTAVWEVTENSNQTVGFTVRGEPWGEVGTAPWTIPVSVRKTFEAQGGTIQATESSGEHGHEVLGRLQAGDPAEATWKST